MDQMHANTNVQQQAKELILQGDHRRLINFAVKWGSPESWVINDLRTIFFHLKCVFGQEPYKLEMHPSLFQKMLKSAEIELLIKLNNAEDWPLTPENVCNMIGTPTGINYIILNENVEERKLYVLDLDDVLIAVAQN